MGVAVLVASACTAPASSILVDAAVPLDAAAPLADAAADARVAPDGTTLRLLFVGNSYTFVNDLPSIVEAALASAPEVASLEVESVTAGSALLRDHWNAGTAADRIRSGAFTHVVLQGQSLEPCDGGPAQFYEHGMLFAELAHESGAIPVFFETWARRAGDPIYTLGLPALADPGSMQGCLDQLYEVVAWDSMSQLAAVGDAWALALAARPDLALHQDDGSHPTLAGSWLAAAVMVCSIARRSARGLAAPAGLSASDADFLAGIADRECAIVASGVEDGTDNANTAGCLYGSAIPDRGCGEDAALREAHCAEWVNGILPGAVARCAYAPRVRDNRCRRADACTGSECTCGDGPECPDDQMCVRDAAGPHCVCIIPAMPGPQ